LRQSIFLIAGIYASDLSRSKNHAAMQHESPIESVIEAQSAASSLSDARHRRGKMRGHHLSYHASTKRDALLHCRA
jgi:hypothetical protein